MPKPRGQTPYSRPTYDQARHIIQKFGGEPKLAKLLGVHRSSIYRWGYSRPVGTDGLVPSTWIKRINEIARMEGVLLLPEDWAVRKHGYKNGETASDSAPPLRVKKSLAELLE